MVDDLLLSLNELSSVLIPVVALICLILLALLLYRVYLVLKRLPQTLDKVEKVLESTNDSVEKLEKPLDTLNNVSGTVDMVNNATAGAVNSIASFSLKHSDALLNSMKDLVGKKKHKNEEDEYTEEDFGVYDE
ncbi:hypothetical protein ERUR111494_05590 [Erysipelothrix urinaevulpis]|uniref:hypothetical protein n=1 Tax=Erysipelothrix urinaevulpis TaxID=2683717 RepID=UPI001358EF21|nr:hypothetical protein [Erysipelothrix urinaevulpis]